MFTAISQITKPDVIFLTNVKKNTFKQKMVWIVGWKKTITSTSDHRDNLYNYDTHHAGSYYNNSYNACEPYLYPYFPSMEKRDTFSVVFISK